MSNKLDLESIRESILNPHKEPEFLSHGFDWRDKPSKLMLRAIDEIKELREQIKQQTKGNDMKASDYIKREILKEAYEWAELECPDLSTPKLIRKEWDNPDKDTKIIDPLQDIKCEFRETYTQETNIPHEFDSYYESHSVAKSIGGKWIGWTHWYGGGKHGEPEFIEWIDDAYFLEIQSTKTVVEHIFKKVEPGE